MSLKYHHGIGQKWDSRNLPQTPACKKISKEPVRMALKVVFCCQSVTESPSLVSHGRVEKHGDEVSHAVVQKSLSLSRGVRATQLESLRGTWRGRDGHGAWRASHSVEDRAIRARGKEQSGERKEKLNVCVRCGMAYRDEDNSPVACKYHGHMTGDRGLYALAPPHQGIDGEWTDASGVIVYKWNSENDRPGTGSRNWKRRWTCCGVYAEDAVPCHSGSHVSYDDGATRF